MSAFTGFNPNQIEQLSRTVNTISNEVGNSIRIKLESGIVTPISQAWFTQEGVDYFNSFRDAVRNSENIIQEIFNAFNQGLRKAGENWADQVRSRQRVSVQNVGRPNLNINVSAVRPDRGGDIGIDENAANAVANQVAGIRADIQAELKSQAQRLEANAAFMGHGQADAVRNCFTQINEEVARIFRILDEDGDGQSLRSAIKAAVTKYGQIGANTSSFFNAS